MGNRHGGDRKRRVALTASQLLIYGYTRTEIEPLLSKQIVPNTIVNIVWMLFDFNHRKLLFCLHANTFVSQNHDPLYFTYIGSNGSSWNASFWTQNWKINDNMGVCSTTGLQRYPKIFSKYHHIFGSVVLFVCGHGQSSGYEHKCFCAIFVDTNVLAKEHQASQKFNADRWELPHHTLNKMGSNSLAFSSQHQKLFSVGGVYYPMNSYQKQYISNLSFLDFKDDIDNIATWKWQPLQSTIGARECPSSVVIEKYNKLFIVGGKGKKDQGEKSMLIYDIENDQVKKGADCTVGMHSSCFHQAGIVNNQYNTDEIYVGGGTDTSQSVRLYDAAKNMWYALADTSLKYSTNPVLWLEDGYKLYIASHLDRCCECLDLRQAKEWSIVHDKGTLFSDLFGAYSENEQRTANTRLVTS